MWQYYKAALISEDKIKVINCSWSKMMEHAWIWNKTMDVVHKELLDNPQRVIWVWDYSCCAPFVWTYEDVEKIDVHNAAVTWLEVWRFEDIYIINHDKECYINITQQEFNKDLQDSWKAVVHPLPLLCRAETEDAWWDYHSEINNSIIWAWCWDRIEVKVIPANSKPNFPDYRDETNDLFFKEEL